MCHFYSMFLQYIPFQWIRDSSSASLADLSVSALSAWNLPGWDDACRRGPGIHMFRITSDLAKSSAPPRNRTLDRSPDRSPLSTRLCPWPPCLLLYPQRVQWARLGPRWSWSQSWPSPEIRVLQGGPKVLNPRFSIAKILISTRWTSSFLY